MSYLAQTYQKNWKIKLFRAKKRFLELILNGFFFAFSSNEINF